MYVEIALVAYITDRLFGEFKFIRHPVVLMGNYIKWFEKRFYKDSLFRGILLSVSLIMIVFFVSYGISNLLSGWGQPDLHLIIIGIIASTTIASKMLYDSVKDIIVHPKHIQYLVSRDTENLTDSDINKAAIETYAENLSDGVIAPLFYLVLFGLAGAFIYKAINTMDSMIGYHSNKYERFGKFSARLDDVVNYIPARLTALLIILLLGYKGRHVGLPLREIWRMGSKHESPNAGYPITAMAFSLGIMLGGDTPYFGKVKKKPYFGKSRKNILKEDILNALSLQPKLDIFIIIVVGCCILTTPM